MNDCFVCHKHVGNVETSGVMTYEDEYVGHIANMKHQIFLYYSNNESEKLAEGIILLMEQMFGGENVN